MASPYLLLGAFPEAIRFLPKPGAWMDTFKQLMGFVLLGTVVFILTFLRPQHVIPTVGLLFGLWAACWWIGRLSPLAEGPARLWPGSRRPRLPALVWVLMFPGTDGAFRAAMALPAWPAVMEERLGLAERPSGRRRPPPIARQTAGPQTVLVDFTANWCVNCKVSERTKP